MSYTVERLHRAGLRSTGPRVRILEALEHDHSHPTAEQLFETLRPDYPSLSLSTVYQTLDTFLHAGLCRRVASNGNRLRVDGTPQDHDHAHCRTCGTIFDVDRQQFRLPPPPHRLPNGCIVTAWYLEYDVICSACQKVAGE